MPTPLSLLRTLEPRLRAAALFPLAALLVHQLRYLAASGAAAGRVLDEQGHGYLSVVVAPLALVAAAALGAYVAHVFVRGGPDGPRPARIDTRPAWVMWLAAAAALLAVYTGQELLEGALASGHPPGLAGVLGGGGWLAVPAALVVAGALTFLLRLAERVLRGRTATLRPLPVAPQPARTPARVDRPRTAPLALQGAGRAPPAPSQLSS